MSLLTALRDILLSPPPIRLKCRPGDIARIIQTGYNQDRLVRVVRAMRDEPGCWWVEPLQECYAYNLGIYVGPGCKDGSCSDRYLQPLRDQPGQDESLRWVPKKRPVQDIGVIRPKQTVWM